VLAVRDALDGRLNNYDRLLYEAQVYLVWRQTGQLPAATIYDLPCDLVLTLSAIHSDVEAEGAEHAARQD